MTKEQAVALGITFETDTPTQEEIDEKISKRLTELTGENSKYKSAISKVNSENAEYKRKEQERLTDDEKKAQHQKELEDRVAEYEKRFARSNKVNDYIGIGYDKALAEEIADAELEGKPTAELHQKHLKAREEAIKKELMKENPSIKQGEPKPKVVTKEEYEKMSYSQKMELKEKNPDLFEKFHK